MDEGTLYVARFDDNGVGSWLPLTMDSPVQQKESLASGVLGDHFNSLADIILNTAGAADLVGATPMDRPEWGAVDPINGAVYMSLTNNSKRTTETNAANPRLNNTTGHIIRWQEGADVKQFSWDIFVFGAPSDGAPQVNISGLDDLNQFASPDGLAFDKRGILWIQTDNGAPELSEYSNDQMLAVVPSQLTTKDGQLDSLNAGH